jgi:hypothetical protein
VASKYSSDNWLRNPEAPPNPGSAPSYLVPPLIANGGIITQPFTNYKLLANTLNDTYGSNAKVFSRSALQGSLPSPLIDYGSLTEVQRGSAYVPFSINSWISATQTMAPSYISTNLLGDLDLRLTMADNSILQTW